jgi:hypothetical protein
VDPLGTITLEPGFTQTATGLLGAAEAMVAVETRRVPETARIVSSRGRLVAAE